jgi:hypothetical protein
MHLPGQHKAANGSSTDSEATRIDEKGGKPAAPADSFAGDGDDEYSTLLVRCGPALRATLRPGRTWI